YWDLAGNLETRRIFTAPLNLRLENGARVEFNIIPTRDVLLEPFEISTGLILPVKAYDFTSYRFEFDTPNHLGLVFNLSWSFGPFYSGTYDNLRLGLNLKMKGYATLALTANLVRGRLAEGNFSENLLGLKADFYFTPDLGLLNNIQYDDVSGQIGANIRFRWRVSPGNEVFFVYNKNWERRWDPLSRFVPLEGRGVFKVVFSWRP
ncbi:MAG: hypothetical protein JW843_08705, partial [Candidatus Aminicenantes bacterium]|nr:hypothetical protein [Candidatus Aminicenantes bacterium]